MVEIDLGEAHILDFLKNNILLLTGASRVGQTPHCTTMATPLLRGISTYHSDTHSVTGSRNNKENKSLLMPKMW